MSLEKIADGNWSESEAEHATDLFHVDFSHTGHSLAILTSIILISLMKIVLERFQRVPHSVLLLVFGILTSFFISLVFEDEIFLRPSWFFVYLLPVIMFDAGYFLKNKQFFRNIGTISTYAVIGTLFNAACMAFMLYVMRDMFTMPLSFLEIAIFATLISAVDPVAVLCVFEDIHVNDVLYICVFGESLLNDAVTIVLYQTITNILIGGSKRLGAVMYMQSVAQFVTVAFGGITMGIIGGLSTALAMRLLTNHQAVIPLMMILMPIFFYLITDSFHLSGILAIVTCGILVKNYMRGNLCDEMHFVVEYFYKMATSFSESFIFVFLGASVVSPNHVFDIWFIVASLVGCFVFRFVGVYLLTFFLNRFRFEDERISYVDQFVLAYGGIRGAVCYAISIGLVMSIDENLIPAKPMFVTTTLAVIMFTIAVQGTTIKFIVTSLKVKRSKEPVEKRGVFDSVVYETVNHIVDFVENVTNVHGENFVYRKILEFDENVLKPKLVAYHRPRNASIIDRHVEIELSEFATSVRRGTYSFSSLPTNTSVNELHLPLSKSERFAAGFNQKTLAPPCASPVSFPQPTVPPQRIEASISEIPPDASVAGIVAHAFETTEQQRNLSRGKARRALYSRHLLENVPLSPSTALTEHDNAYLVTLPHGKNPRLAGKIRQFGLSLQDQNRNNIADLHCLSTAQQYSNSIDQGTTPSSTKPHPYRPPILSRFTVETNDNADNVSATIKKKSERTVVGNNKKFTVGEETRELLPIDEENRDLI